VICFPERGAPVDVTVKYPELVKFWLEAGVAFEVSRKITVG
jgi:hypothetical protein